MCDFTWNDSIIVCLEKVFALIWSKLKIDFQLYKSYWWKSLGQGNEKRMLSKIIINDSGK